MDYLKIGKKLKSLREKKGLSLHQIYEVTRIQISILTDIEKGQFKKSEIFLKNFIKTYCEALGLDFQKLMESEGEVKSDFSRETPEEPDTIEFSFFKQNKTRIKLGFFSASGLILLFLAFQFLPSLIKKASNNKAQQKVTKANKAEKSKSSNKQSTAGQDELVTTGQGNPAGESRQQGQLGTVGQGQEVKQNSAQSNTDKSLWPKLKNSSFNHEVMIRSSEKLTLYFKADKPSVLTKELAPWEWFVIKAKKFIYIRLDEIKTETQVFYNGQKLEINSKKFFESTFQ